MSKHHVIDTVPGHHYLTSSLLCDLTGQGAGTTPDFLCGDVAKDCEPGRGRLIWYHWDGTAWQRSVVVNDYCVTIGLAVADLTGNGKLDIIFSEWADYSWLSGKGRGEGGIYWAEQPKDPVRDPWPIHRLVDKDCVKLHDVLAGDVSGDGKPGVLQRNKNGKISWFAQPDEPNGEWLETIVTPQQDGDGTSLYDITGSGSLDIVTGTGFYRNVSGDGKAWSFQSFSIEELDLHPEQRVAAGDLMGDGSVCVVITESEVSAEARIVLVHSTDKGATWQRHILVDKQSDLRALHTLELIDVTGDGRLDIFTGEMENQKTDGTERKPKWWVFLNQGGLRFERQTVLDDNLGCHNGCAGLVRGPGRISFVAKEWFANEVNGCGGRNHVVEVSYECNPEK